MKIRAFSFLVVGGEWVGKCWTWQELAAMRLSESFLRTLCGQSALMVVPGASERRGWDSFLVFLK